MSNGAMNLVIAKIPDGKSDEHNVKTLESTKTNDVKIVSREDEAMLWLINNMDKLNNLIKETTLDDRSTEKPTTSMDEESKRYFVLYRWEHSHRAITRHAIFIEIDDDSMVFDTLPKFINLLPPPSIIDKLKYICPKEKPYPIYFTNDMKCLLMEYNSLSVPYTDKFVGDDIFGIFNENIPDMNTGNIIKLTFDQYLDLLINDIVLLSEYMDCMNFWECCAFKQEIKAITKIKKAYLKVFSSYKKSIETIAKEVINGKWGNGATRKQRLEVAGYNYNEVQKKVNELLTSH